MSFRAGSIISINGQFPDCGNDLTSLYSVSPSCSFARWAFIGARTVPITKRGSFFLNSLSAANGRGAGVMALPELFKLSGLLSVYGMCVGGGGGGGRERERE